MNFANEMAQAPFYPAAPYVAYGTTTEKRSVGKKAACVVISAAIALGVGFGLARVCTDCFTEEIAYADPIEETVADDKGGAGLLAETLKGMGE